VLEPAQWLPADAPKDAFPAHREIAAQVAFEAPMAAAGYRVGLIPDPFQNATPMSTLICGSIAFDSIMVFHDRFRNHILPEQIHILNVSFVPEMRRDSAAAPATSPTTSSCWAASR
jgi:hypothetical protein